MRREVLLVIARQFWINAFRSKGIFPVSAVMAVLLAYGAFSGITYHEQNHSRSEHQEIARGSWEANPDKHPHRMAHFGTFAFRMKHPLSAFDFGIESYTGNAVFLEAHRQNTVNLSEASFSTGLLRFGELSMAMVLQTILPLILFFLGHSAIVSDRENGTLKILLSQGANWKEIIFGNVIGLYAIGLLFTIPFLLTTLGFIGLEAPKEEDIWMRFLVLAISYLVYCLILCSVCISIAANSKSSRNSLVKLLGMWLMLVVLLPRSSQALGTYFHPTPSKLAFKEAVENEVIQYGDSHDPNDPHFKSLRDSVLRVHQVEDVTELPFNYSGFVMSQGERISARIFTKHRAQLTDQFRKQNSLMRWLSIINPFIAIKNLSMALCGSDFESYVHFQDQAEVYRYKLAQTMNELQMKYISPTRTSSEGKTHVVKRQEWKNFKDFDHEFNGISTVFIQEILSILSVSVWMIVSMGLLVKISRNIKAV